ncbi:ammonia-forming cytochrome c nitrite reductase subunit c552 [Propioniciclava sp.]|uniref:ammonia-forming cytochrome c nitrite reductase subunit c552 n=1 Tax=Propioniciclava sp. TaxID=2038686 RepID=UPI00262FE699|nr:ammonia-forming cytochrome c nitrite reductase subunit c552 [Propioniciclava sp.]
MSTSTTEKVGGRKPRWGFIATVLVLGAVVAVGVLALLVDIFTKRTEAQQPYFQVVQLTDTTYDPAVWGQNFPLQYEGWLKTQEMPADEQLLRTPTADDPRTVMAKSKLEADPRLVTMWQGYAFSVEYNEPRGHMYMLEDQRLVKRVTMFKQPGACLNCHASLPEVVNTLGNGDAAAGWAAMNKMPYSEATTYAQHPVGCIDCHDPATMKLRVTRPAFIEGIKEYKASEAGGSVANFDVNTMASAKEMRTYVCAQCHVEYYFAGDEKTLTFPWEKGLTVNDAMAYYDEIGWSDFTHKLTGAPVIKAQHPDFETFSQGVHASAGVTCADCHMPYKREGAAKITDHQVASPMRTNETINTTCLTCHRTSEEEMRARVDTIHNRYEETKNTAFDALDQLIADIVKARENGTDQARIEEAWAYQRQAQFIVDYVTSENSRGFHAPAYTNQILNQATDAARRGQLALLGQTYPPASAPSPAPVPEYTPPPASPTPSPQAPETASAPTTP